MINIVLDTNIIISSALTPQGVTAKIMNFIIDSEKTNIYYSSKIIAEYQKQVKFRNATGAVSLAKKKQLHLLFTNSTLR